MSIKNNIQENALWIINEATKSRGQVNLEGLQMTAQRIADLAESLPETSPEPEPKPDPEPDPGPEPEPEPEPEPVPDIPARVTQVRLSDVGEDFIVLDWTRNSDNEEGFRIHSCLDVCSFGNSKVIGTTEAGVTEFTAQGLSPGAAYRFWVVAFNAAGAAERSNTRTFWTLGDVEEPEPEEPEPEEEPITPTDPEPEEIPEPSIPDEGTAEDPNAFFAGLVASGYTFNDHAYSFRSDADIARVLGSSNVGPPPNAWQYVYGTDPAPNSQDAAKASMGKHLGGQKEQIRISFKAGNHLSDGNAMFIFDVYHDKSFRDHKKTTDRYKFCKWLVSVGPKRQCRIDQPPQTFGIHDVSIEPSRPWPAGHTKSEPGEPTGPGLPDARTITFPMEMWTREVDLFELAVPGNDVRFDIWNNAYGIPASGYPIGTRPIVATTPDGANTIIEVVDGNAGHSDENRNEFHKSASHVQKVTITGCSDSAVNGTHLYTYIDSDHISIPVVSTGGIGGTVSRHFLAYSQWLWDEITDPVCAYYRRPMKMPSGGAMEEFQIHVSTSTNGHKLMVGERIVASPTTVDGVTTFITENPHPFTTGELVQPVAFHSRNVSGGFRQGSDFVEGSASGGFRAYCTVVDANTITIPCTATAVSEPWVEGQTPGDQKGLEGTHGYVAKTQVMWMRGIWIGRNVPAPTDPHDDLDPMFFARPIGRAGKTVRG